MNFAAENNKHYDSIDDFEKRQNIFHDNILKINNNNRKNKGRKDDLVLGANYMTDWSPEEFSARLNLP